MKAKIHAIAVIAAATMILTGDRLRHTSTEGGFRAGQHTPEQYEPDAEQYSIFRHRDDTGRGKLVAT